jgi:hypothetical protein
METRRSGEEIPIVSLTCTDPTDRMLCDAVVMYHTYPHVDFYETGERAARLLLRILAGEVRPVTAVVTIPALVRGDELITATGLLGGFLREAQAIEQGPGGLVAGMFIGNPFTDVPGLCSRSVVVTDGDAARAEREALKLAEGFWEVRERLQAPLISLDEAARVAARTAAQYPDGRRRRDQFRRPATATPSCAPWQPTATASGRWPHRRRRRWRRSPEASAPRSRAQVGGALDPKRTGPCRSPHVSGCFRTAASGASPHATSERRRRPSSKRTPSPWLRRVAR